MDERKSQDRLPEVETKEFKSGFKAWIRVVAFIIIAVFLPEQVAQAAQYDWRVIWNKPASYNPSNLLVQNTGSLDIPLIVKNILNNVANKPVNAIKLSPTLTIELEKPLKISAQRIEEIYDWLRGKPCGSKALFDYLNFKGAKTSEEDIAVMALSVDILNGVTKPEGSPEIIKTSLYALSKASEFFGEKLYSVEIQGLTPAPFIAHFKSGHYVLVTKVTDSKVFFSDNHQEKAVTQKEFLDRFSGYALVADVSSGIQEVSDSEAMKVLGATLVDSNGDYWNPNSQSNWLSSSGSSSNNYTIPTYSEYVNSGNYSYGPVSQNWYNNNVYNSVSAPTTTTPYLSTYTTPYRDSFATDWLSSYTGLNYSNNTFSYQPSNSTNIYNNNYSNYSTPAYQPSNYVVDWNNSAAVQSWNTANPTQSYMPSSTFTNNMNYSVPTFTASTPVTADYSYQSYVNAGGSMTLPNGTQVYGPLSEQGYNQKLNQSGYNYSNNSLQFTPSPLPYANSYSTDWLSSYTGLNYGANTLNTNTQVQPWLNQYGANMPNVGTTNSGFTAVYGDNVRSVNGRANFNNPALSTTTVNYGKGAVVFNEANRHGLDKAVVSAGRWVGDKLGLSKDSSIRETALQIWDKPTTAVRMMSQTVAPNFTKGLSSAGLITDFTVAPGSQVTATTVSPYAKNTGNQPVQNNLGLSINSPTAPVAYKVVDINNKPVINNAGFFPQTSQGWFDPVVLGFGTSIEKGPYENCLMIKGSYGNTVMQPKTLSTGHKVVVAETNVNVGGGLPQVTVPSISRTDVTIGTAGNGTTIKIANNQGIKVSETIKGNTMVRDFNGDLYAGISTNPQESVFDKVYLGVKTQGVYNQDFNRLQELSQIAGSPFEGPIATSVMYGLNLPALSQVQNQSQAGMKSQSQEGGWQVAGENLSFVKTDDFNKASTPVKSTEWLFNAQGMNSVYVNKGGVGSTPLKPDLAIPNDYALAYLPNMGGGLFIAAPNPQDR
ncbi:MAG: hypothetical protein FJZ15_05715, partial [Candidatus Omnitrophica bacterium]|nr:hypothetical protein [Candidatus Omnitrophota bacterium]